MLFLPSTVSSENLAPRTSMLELSESSGGFRLVRKACTTPVKNNDFLIVQGCFWKVLGKFWEYFWNMLGEFFWIFLGVAFAGCERFLENVWKGF